jgi:hypothetical protein
MIRPEDAEMNEIAEKGKEAVCDWRGVIGRFINIICKERAFGVFYFMGMLGVNDIIHILKRFV